MNSTEIPYQTVPLGGKAHRLAQQFASEQTSPQKGTKTYLNTLAVYAVHSYLQWLQVETDLSQGDSWHPGLRSLFDVADLVLPGLGRLECRPVLPGETCLALPPEVTTDRIGYVAVRLGEHLDQAQLLGFSAVDLASTPEEIQLAELQPFDTLLDSIPSVVEPVPGLSPSKRQVNLSDWFENRFEIGWQTLAVLFGTTGTPALSVRHAEQLRDVDVNSSEASVTAGKLIDLGMQLAGHPVVLLVTLALEVEEIVVRLRVYPAGRQIYLPPSLRLIVVDEFGTVCLEAQARSDDNWMQLKFSGESGERFSVRVALGDISITEDFVI